MILARASWLRLARSCLTVYKWRRSVRRRRFCAAHTLACAQLEAVAVCNKKRTITGKSSQRAVVMESSTLLVMELCTR